MEASIAIHRPGPALAAGALLAAGMAHAGPAVYTTTDAAAGNDVVIFDRAPNGTLSPAGTVSTGGTGTGSGLGNQGAVVLAGHWLLAVNAGSDDISVFRVDHDGLTLTDV